MSTLSKLSHTIDLGVGDPSDGPPELLQRALDVWGQDSRASHYPSPYGEPALVEAVVRHYERTAGVHLNGETEICITHGARPALLFALLSLDRRGGPVGFISPCYIGFRPIITDSGMTPVGMATAAWPRTDAELDEMFMKLRGGAFLLNNPQNPVGFVLSPTQLQKMVAFSRAHDVQLVSDAVYTEIYEGQRPASLLQFERAAVEVISISKTFRACGWRVGAVVGNANLIRRLKAIYTAMNGVPFANQMTAATALSEMVDVERWRQEVAHRRAVLSDGLRALGFGVDTCVNNQGGIFIWASLPPGVFPSSLDAAVCLEAAGVTVCAGSIFGAGGEGFLRFSLNVPSTVLLTALTRIATVEMKHVHR